MDSDINIVHLRLATIGGMVILAFGLISLIYFHHLPVLSFVVGPLISITSWRALRSLEVKRGFVEVRLHSRRRR